MKTANASVVFLMGATASGKTALAIELATRFDIDLISVDSSLVYRGLDIGSAKPDAATLANFPHALVDIRDPEQTYSAAEFAADARAAIARSHSRDRLPLLVGGTGLYFRALERGLSPLPAADRSFRATIAAEASAAGWAALHARLNSLDPVAAARIHRNDPQRISRALEVISLTGKRLSDQQLSPLRATRSWRLLKLCMPEISRSQLHGRIHVRLDSMWETGLLNEVQRLQQRPQHDDQSTSMRAVGYRQAIEHLRGDYDFGECRLRALHASRQLAKRQLTWLRREVDAIVLRPDVSQSATLRIAAFLPSPHKLGEREAPRVPLSY